MCVKLANLSNRYVSCIFTKTVRSTSFAQCCMYELSRLSVQFSEFFAFCADDGGVSLEFNCHAAIVKVHLLFRNLGTRRAVPLNFAPQKFQLAGLSLFRHFPRITTGIALPRCLPANNIDPIARHFAVRHLLSLAHLLTSLPPFRPIYPIRAAINS